MTDKPRPLWTTARTDEDPARPLLQALKAARRTLSLHEHQLDAAMNVAAVDETVSVEEESTGVVVELRPGQAQPNPDWITVDPGSQPEPARSQPSQPMLTTGDNVPNAGIAASVGLVTGESVSPVRREGLGQLVETAEGNATVRQQLAHSRQLALSSLQASCSQQEADAVVGVRINYTFVGEMLVVTATGTAVKLKS